MSKTRTPRESFYNTAIIGAGGNRGFKYTTKNKDAGTKFNIVSIAETDKKRRDTYIDSFPELDLDVYKSGKELLKNGKGFNNVFITTPDHMHKDLAISALERDYNLLLEKPMANTLEDCQEIMDAYEQSKARAMVCHVLKHGQWAQEIKNLISNSHQNSLGKLKHINMTEYIGDRHCSHAYVRGQWAQENDKCGPILLTKSCHDTDLIEWWVPSSLVKAYSEGSLTHFVEENAPEDSADNCLECKVKNCKYDAIDYYVDGDIFQKGKKHTPENIDYPQNVISRSTNREERIDALKNEASQYARCAFKCDNNVMDNQTVEYTFEDKVTADFKLTYKGEHMTRQVNIEMENGNIYGDLAKGELYVQIKGEKAVQIPLNDKGGHGGGDVGILRSFQKLIESDNPENDPDLNKTSIERSLKSHEMVFKAEESRKLGEEVYFN
ncbi:hypothetical protein GF378_01915 [Candidatus Pacearchaeota archaeon]|nr:hypothetical protein [Candidatus Pacearchaeota archaeon]